MSPSEQSEVLAKIPQLGVKHDQGKPMMSLLDSDWLLDVARVLTFGAKKYAAHNWRNGLKVSKILDAIGRHQAAINKGEDIDPESGLPHSAHLSCEVMFLHWTIINRKDMDDRWVPNQDSSLK